MRILIFAAALVVLGAGIARAQDITDAELTGEMRFHGGQHASAYQWQVLTGDVTCDGDADKVGSYVSLDNPDGPRFFLVVVAREEGQLVSESVVTPFDSADQAGLCGTGNPPPKISLEQFTDEEAREMLGIEGACPLAIIVEDGMCDLHHYFWVPEWEEDRKLIFFRN
ncbi:MAG: hypothetical protein JJ959_05145 [Nisaea sp.]|uniref:hypothetical protein n=1 Tax=Nisaea sp. TaxID=2024842 RepID=UPI001B078ABF|nr:hypothetical protein [Nisaea sp.]MBO6559897.1 hypothetical protein [Nisaea sp.]